MEIAKNIGWGLLIIAAALYAVGAMTCGIVWFVSLASHSDAIWYFGWWPWFFLAGWPLSALALVMYWAYALGRDYREKP